MVVSGVDTLIRCCGIRVLDSMARITKVGRAREREKGSKDSNRGEGSLDRRVYAKRAIQATKEKPSMARDSWQTWLRMG